MVVEVEKSALGGVPFILVCLMWGRGKYLYGGCGIPGVESPIGFMVNLFPAPSRIIKIMKSNNTPPLIILQPLVLILRASCACGVLLWSCLFNVVVVPVTVPIVYRWPVEADPFRTKLLFR